MFNCYSGSGVAGGQATAFSLQRAFSSQLREQLCLHLEPPASTFPPRFLSFSPSVSPSPPQSLPSFHRSPSPFLAATTRPRSLLGLSAAVSINLPSLTLFNGVRSPLARRYFRPKLRFESLTHPSTFSFQGGKDRGGRARRIYALCVLRLASIVYWILIQVRDRVNEYSKAFFIFLFLGIRNWKGISRLLILFLKALVNLRIEIFLRRYSYEYF